MEYTLAGAAKAVGIGKTTLHTAIKRGRLSARRLEDGSYRIDASELARVYPLVPAERSEPSPWDDRERQRDGSEGVGTEPNAATELAVMRARLEGVEAQLARERETVDDLRARLDREQEERRALQLRLMPPEKPQESPVVVEDLRKRLEEAEARIATLAASERPQDGRNGSGEGVTAAKPSRGFLSRLLRL